MRVYDVYRNLCVNNYRLHKIIIKVGEQIVFVCVFVFRCVRECCFLACDLR